MQPHDSLDGATDRLVRSTMLIGLLPGIVIGLALLLVNPFLGLVAFVVVASAWAAVVRSRASAAAARVLSGIDVEPLRPGSRPRLENVLAGLCVSGGVSDPTVHLLDVPSMNAAVVADGERAHLVLTTGLADGLGRLELEGVLANLLGRIRDGSARYGTTVVSVLGSSGFATRRLAAGLGAQRSVHSDLAAVDMTRYPPGLIAALAKMDVAGTIVDGAPVESAHLWLAPPLPRERIASDAVAETALQPLALRIAVLEEL